MHPFFIYLAVIIATIYVINVATTYTDALYNKKSALEAYRKTQKYPSFYTEKDEEEAIAKLHAAQKLKSQSFVFFIPLVNSFFDRVKSSKETDMTVENLLAERERGVRQKALEQARAEMARERAEELRRFEKMLQER